MDLPSALERFLERLFERPASRLLRARPRPLQLLRFLERAMEAARRTADGRTTVPDALELRLHPEDLSGLGAHPAAIAGELADGLLTFARRHGYVLAGRPRVELVADPMVARGDVLVASGTDGDRPPAAWPAAPGDATAVFEFKPAESPFAVLRVLAREGPTREIALDGSPLTIGRARDNGLVLGDARVSRHHARISGRRGALVLTDLGSTNGSRVNGLVVDEVVLGEGDRIVVGDTVLIIEPVEG
jgi:hypothetical protein